MAEEKFDWNQLEEAKKNLVKRAEAFKKAFIQMPGGAPAEGGMPADAAGGAPMDPAAAGAAGAAGGAPMDPAAAMDPAMLAAMGGAPLGVDPATAGMLGGMPPDAGAVSPDAGAGAAAAGAAPSPEPTITISLSQLWDIVTKVLGLAKKIGANGQGIDTGSAPAGQDAIKAAVIEALGDMGLTR